MHSAKNMKTERRSGGPDRFKDGPGARGNREPQQNRDTRENGAKGGEKKPEHALQSRDRSEKPRKERDVSVTVAQQPEEEVAEKKFTGRCRLFVGNIPGDWAEDQFKKMFAVYGDISEAYVNAPRGFGFIRLDTRSNAESAKRALDGTMHKNRMLRVRFAAHSAALKVKYLPPHVTNELLEEAFSQFGEVERAVVIGDDRGKSVGEGIVEFARKTGAQQALNRINNGVFLMGVAPRPIVVEALEQRDEDDGVSDKFQPKTPSSYRERERDPGFAEPGSFEFEYGQKWKDLYNLERQRQEQLKREMEDAFVKLESDMEGAEQEYQTVLLRQDLMRRQEELRVLEEEVARRRGMNRMGLEGGRKEDMRHFARGEMEDDRRRQEMIMRQQQEEMRRREMEQRGMRSREEERKLLMQAQHMREQGMSQQQQQQQQQAQGQPQMQRQSRFDQPPHAQAAMFSQMANQNAAMQNMQQGGNRGQSNANQQQQQQQGQHGGQGHEDGAQQMERERQREELYEHKRARRY